MFLLPSVYWLALMATAVDVVGDFVGALRFHVVGDLLTGDVGGLTLAGDVVTCDVGNCCCSDPCCL